MRLKAGHVSEVEVASSSISFQLGAREHGAGCHNEAPNSTVADIQKPDE